MKTTEIKAMQQTCKELLIGKMLDYVRQHGEPVTVCHRHIFGLDDSDGKTLRVLDFYNDGGCVFTLNRGGCWETYAVQCLYTVEHEGEEYLMSYCLYNEGMEYDEDMSDSDHESMFNEPLAYVNAIADRISING